MLLEGVYFCAQKGIMHRDIKPENLLFAKRGSYSELKLVDFGLSTLESEVPYIFPKCTAHYIIFIIISNLFM